MGTRVVVGVGTNKGAFFFHSDRNRREWRMTGPHMAGWEVYSLHGETGNGRRVFAGTSSFVYGPTVRVSEDGGATWAQIEAGPKYAAGGGLKLARIWQIVPGHPSEPGTLYAGVEEAGLFVGRDGGRNWAEVEGLTKHPTRPHWFPGGGGLCLHTILIDPTNPKRMWVAVSAAGVFRTEDGGATWAVRNKGLRTIATGTGENDVCHCVHKIVLDPADPNTLFMQYHGGVYKSHDGADSWTATETGLPGNFGFPLVRTTRGDLFVVPLTSDENRVVKDGRLKVYRSKDGGQGWQEVGKGLPQDPRYVGVLRDAMAADALDPGGVYFGTTMGEVYASPDGGETWHQLPGQLGRITTVKAWMTED